MTITALGAPNLQLNLGDTRRNRPGLYIASVVEIYRSTAHCGTPHGFHIKYGIGIEIGQCPRGAGVY